MDCAGFRAVLQQFVLAGEADGDVAEALEHVSTCAECRPLFDVEPTAACDAVEEDLLEAARSRLSGDELAGKYPAVARHVQECERCQAVFADLTTESREAPDLSEPPEERVEPQIIFERAFTDALTDKEPVVRLRAAERVRGADWLEPAVLTALAEVAQNDPAPHVRAAAQETLDVHADSAAAAAVPVEKDEMLGRLRLPRKEDDASDA